MFFFVNNENNYINFDEINNYSFRQYFTFDEVDEIDEDFGSPDTKSAFVNLNFILNNLN